MRVGYITAIQYAGWLPKGHTTWRWVTTVPCSIMFGYLSAVQYEGGCLIAVQYEGRLPQCRAVWGWVTSVPCSIRVGRAECMARCRLKICWATTDSTSSSMRLNSSKQVHAPHDARPCMGKHDVTSWEAGPCPARRQTLHGKTWCHVMESRSMPYTTPDPAWENMMLRHGKQVHAS